MTPLHKQQNLNIKHRNALKLEIWVAEEYLPVLYKNKNNG